MLAALSRGRLLLALTLGIGVVGLPAPAVADEEEEEEEEEEGGGGEEEEEGEEEEDPKEQPPVTAGGLYTIKTYPLRELFRPLTMTEKITQLRLSLGSDVSDKTAFEYFGVSLEGRYGYRDNFTILGGFTSDYNFKGFSFNAGFEGALAYDLFDIRLQANLNRTAQTDPDGFVESSGSLVPGNFIAGKGVQFSVDLGFPFRYVARPEIAIVALETLISFDFNAVKRGDGGGGANAVNPALTNVESCLAIPGMNEALDPDNCTEDGIKPDLAPSLGIATNPVAPLSVVLFAQLQIRDFDTTNQFTIPATARIQFSPNQKLDIGLEFKFLDLKPKDPDGPDGMACNGGMASCEAPPFFVQRFLNMYVQARY